jgi:small subunit ribosomal protein S17
MAQTKITGVVSSDKADKTIVITVTSRLTHPLYRKQYTRNRKYIAHDENNAAKVGDRVEIIETTPISKRKSFTLHRIIETGHAEVELKDETEEVIEKKEARKSAEKDNKNADKEATT